MTVLRGRVRAAGSISARGTFLAACCCLLFCGAAQAHTPEQLKAWGLAQADTDGGMAKWLHGLQSVKATCCDSSDGKPPEAVVQTRDGHYEVSIEGQWVRVPDDAVITTPNKYRAAVVWYSPTRSVDGNGKVTTTFDIRCFLPPEMY